MTVAPPSLRALRDKTVALRNAWVQRRLDLIEWLPHQAAILRDAARFRLLRTGNQIGKTEVGIAEVLFAALGWHPYREPTIAAGEYWVVCAALKQSIAVQTKLYALCPRDRLKPGTAFTKERAFGGREPHVSVLHEDGTYSIVRFKTTGQEDIDLAGATIDGVLFDEPPKKVSLFTEVMQRVRALNGWILLTLTPIGADLRWLKKMVDEEIVSEHHTRLVPSVFVPEGRTEPLRVRDKKGKIVRWDQSYIDRETRLCPEQYVEIRIHGSWRAKAADAYFGKVWIPDDMVVDDDHWAMQTAAWAQVGVDHGHRPGKQYMPLIYIDDSDPLDPLVVVSDECSDLDGLADVFSDAANILDMLDDNGLQWRDLRFVGGDRDHMPGSRYRKSNDDLSVALVVQMQPAVVPPDVWPDGADYPVVGIEELHELVVTAGGVGRYLNPEIHTVKTGKGRGWGSLEQGYRWLYRRMVARRFYVHKRCVRMIEALDRFRLRNRDDEWKDIMDGLRYGLENCIFDDHDADDDEAVVVVY